MNPYLGEIPQGSVSVMSAGYLITTEGPAKGVAPYVTNQYKENDQAIITNLFRGGDPNVKFELLQNPTTYGPTSAFNTTVQAMEKALAERCFLIWNEIHQSQGFANILAPFAMAMAFRFRTKILTSNLGNVEEAPEHVPATAETNQMEWSETSLTMVQKLIKASLHDIMTPTGLQNLTVSNWNIGIVFNRDVLFTIMTAFMTLGQRLTETLISFYPPTSETARQFIQMSVDMFGILNTDDNSLDRIIEKVNLVAEYNKTTFDTAVVPYNCLNKLALNTDFRNSEVVLQHARSLAETMRLDKTTFSIPSMIYKNEIEVLKYQRPVDLLQSIAKDPMSNTAVVATYHPFGNDPYYVHGVRDIDIVSSRKGGLQRVTLIDAINYLDWDLFANDEVEGYDPEHNPKYASKNNYYNDEPSAKRLKPSVIEGRDDKDLRKLTREFALSTLEGCQYVEDMLNFWAASRQTKLPDVPLLDHTISQLNKYKNDKYNGIDVSRPTLFFVTGLEEKRFIKQASRPLFELYLSLPFTQHDVIAQLNDGLDFPFEMAVVRPFIELETGSLLFCKRGSETARMFHRIPQAWAVKDNKVEMYEVKYQFWRACHIENKRNICVVDHAYVSRVLRGMHTKWSTAKQYLEDPFSFRDGDYDIYPIIVGPRQRNPVYPLLAALSHNISDAEIEESYKTLENNNIKELLKPIVVNECWGEKMGVDPTLWNGDSIRYGAIPRIMGIGYTQQFETSIEESDGGFNIIRIKKCEPLLNSGHMKKLDSPRYIRSLNGLGV